MKKEKYLIAVDMDGTLFNSLYEHDLKSTELLKKLKNDHMVVIATGRPYRSSGFYHNILELDTPIINYNGALVQHRTDPTFPKKLLTIPKEYLFKFIDDTKEYIHNVFCEIEDDIFVQYKTEHIMPHVHNEGGNLMFGLLPEILKNNPHGALVFLKDDYRDILVKYVEENYNGDFKIRFWKSKDEYIGELYNPKISKGQALKDIAEYYNIPRENIIAFGDGENDIEMLEYAYHGVAMGNSSDLVKAHAKHITDNIWNNGVYKFLSEFFNIE